MCGIIGYVSCNFRITVKDVLSVLIGGLSKMEYRGYDSAGVCIDKSNGMHPSKLGTRVENDEDDENFVVIRSVGQIAALESKVFSPEVTQKVDMEETRGSFVGIAHTRWATHGEVCIRNTHPQRCADGSFVVVHNGIMTNYMTVKQLLLSEGYVFNSDTDTEVIATLADYLYRKNPEQTFSELGGELTGFVEGAYAFLLKSVFYPEELIACRKGSPLVIGVRQKDADGNWRRHHAFEPYAPNCPTEFFFASDCLAFAEYTNNILYLEDDDFVHYKDGQIKFYSSKELNQGVSREFQKLEMTLESLSRGNYEHYMLKEIFEQPESLVSTLRGRVNFAKNTVHLGGFTKRNIQNILHSRRIIFISCGTSLNSCHAVRPLWDELVTVPICVENASDFGDRCPPVYRDDTCIFVSQSGETADTLMALKYCQGEGALCVGITNVVGSSISRSTDFGAHLNAGVEVGVASTKAYTSQVILLSIVALLLSADNVSVSARRKAIFDGLESLPLQITEALKNTQSVVRGIAKDLKDARSILVLGRGYDYCSCLEGALKIKELTYIHTEGINSGELKHGPLALVDESIPILAFCVKDKFFEKAKPAVQQINARKGKVIAISTVEDDAELCSSTERIVVVPQTVDCLQPILNIIPIQLLSYHLALERGNNVDRPRNLAKSVTTQ